MIDKIKLWFRQRTLDKEQENIRKWTRMKIHRIDSKGKGLIIFTYGSPEYMVSGRAAMRIRDEIRPLFAEKFPNYTVLFVPFYTSLTGIVEENWE